MPEANPSPQPPKPPARVWDERTRENPHRPEHYVPRPILTIQEVIRRIMPEKIWP